MTRPFLVEGPGQITGFSVVFPRAGHGTPPNACGLGDLNATFS